jgi:hypothetical protein
MALTASKTWVAGEVLTASDLNSEFLNIYNGGQSLGWPATANKDFAGYTLTLDADGDTSIKAGTVDDRIDITLQGTILFRIDGSTATTPVNGYDFIAQDAGTDPTITAVGTDANIGINIVPKGTGTLQQGGTRVLLLGDEETAQTILSTQIFG